MKKILYIITQSEFGGAQRYVFDLAANLSGEFNICVAAGGNPNGELFQKLKEKNIKNIYLRNLKRAINPWHDSQAFLEIRRLIKKEQPDVIHLNSTKAGILGSLAAKFTYSHNSDTNSHNSHCVIYTAHGWVFNEPMPWLKKKIYFWFEKFTARYKDKIICVSEYDRQTALKKSFSNDKLLTIHNGINFEKLNFLPKEEARKALMLKIHPSPPLKKEGVNYLDTQSLSHSAIQIIGTIANLYKTKGIKYLIEAANILYTKYKIQNTKYIVIGEGAERPKLETLIKKYSLENNFFLDGHIQEARKYLKAFDIFVLPSVKEGFPYAILEAMSAEIPLITTRVGGVPEIIKDRENGILAEPKNPQDLAEKINEILNNRELSETMTRNAANSVKENFSLQRMIEQTKKAYCG
jgi:glycosyltransferase involved in cell wall biosynthesis